MHDLIHVTTPLQVVLGLYHNPVKVHDVYGLVHGLCSLTTKLIVPSTLTIWLWLKINLLESKLMGMKISCRICWTYPRENFIEFAVVWINNQT